MKKSIIVLTVVLTMGMGLSAVSAFAWYCNGPGGGYGMRGWSGDVNTSVTDEAYQKFLDETAQIRKSLAVDRAQLNAIMASTEPDAKKVAELTAKIVDNQEALSKIARSANIDVGPGSGYCAGNKYGGKGYGSRGYCNGPGYGHGYGRMR